MEYLKKQDIQEVICLDAFDAYFSNFHSKEDDVRYRKVTIKHYGLAISLISFKGESDILLELKARKVMKKCLVAIVSGVTKRIKGEWHASGTDNATSEE